MRSNGPDASSSARMASPIAAAVASGSNSPPSVSRWMAREMPIAIASRSCSSASAGPRVSTTDSPPCASTRRIASSTPHSSCGLMVKPRWRVSSACSSAVRTILPPVSGTRFTQTRIFMSGPDPRVVGIEDGARADDVDRDAVALVHVLDGQLLRALNGVLRRQVREQDVLADGRAGAGAGDVRATALRVGQRGAVAERDRLAAERVALDPAGARVVVDGERAEDGGGLGLAVAQV